jgi:hypothetical protein
MKTLEQEAQEYFDNNIFCDGITPFEEDISKRCFIAGANSKYVQAEKIKAQIEVLEKAKTLNIQILIENLEKKLNKL